MGLQDLEQQYGEGGFDGHARADKNGKWLLFTGKNGSARMECDSKEDAEQTWRTILDGRKAKGEERSL